MKTVILGENSQTLQRLIFVVTYFLRCGQIKSPTIQFPDVQPEETKSRHLDLSSPAKARINSSLGMTVVSIKKGLNIWICLAIFHYLFDVPPSSSVILFCYNLHCPLERDVIYGRPFISFMLTVNTISISLSFTARGNALLARKKSSHCLNGSSVDTTLLDDSTLFDDSTPSSDSTLLDVDCDRNISESKSVVFVVGGLEKKDERMSTKVRSIARRCRIEKESGNLMMTSQVAALQTDFQT